MWLLKKKRTIQTVSATSIEHSLFPQNNTLHSAPPPQSLQEKQALIGPLLPLSELEDFSCTNQEQMSTAAALKDPAVLDARHMLLIQR